MFPRILLILVCISPLSIAQHDLVYACQSLICDPPKMCIIQDQVAQCLLVVAPTPGTPQSNLIGGPQFTTPQTTQAPPPAVFPGFAPPAPNPPAETTTTTTESPLAPLLNLFGTVPGGAPAITLPTLLPPPTTTTTPPVDICSLPPLTGSCSRARIMWYYDTETGRCERFSFSGCGNLNRFPSKMQCEQACLKHG
ncbi:hypothetical protein Aduo_013581 [Ancylostoma duodenale]